MVLKGDDEIEKWSMSAGLDHPLIDQTWGYDYKSRLAKDTRVKNNTEIRDEEQLLSFAETRVVCHCQH